MSLLKRIVSRKKEEVERRKRSLSIDKFRSKIVPSTRDFKSALINEGISIIAEIKRSSPSAGIIREYFDPIQIAKIYEEDGASAISVLTERNFFGGSNDHLKAVKKEVSLPVLRKDFIIDEFQIYESRYIGADAILLIARILTSEQINRYILTAKKLGLTCLIEVHSPNDLEKIITSNVEIIGINNRNLDTLKIDITNSLRLKYMIPNGCISISESGIRKREDVLKLEEAGFDGILIGESLLKVENPGEKLSELLGRDV